MPAPRHSMDRSLFTLVSDELGARVLARLSEPEMRRLAEELYCKDVYHAASIARRALRSLPAGHDTERAAAAHIEHSLWSSWRSAQAFTGTARKAAWEAQGLECLDETRGQPTILIAPMTLPLVDVLSFMETFLAHRRVVVYGEGLPSSHWNVTHTELSILGEASVRNSMEILHTLQAGGVFCTYPDFVYSGHACVEGTLFGLPRLYSSAFLSFCARPGVHLLPLVLLRDRSRLQARIYDPIVLALQGAAAKSSTRMLLLPIVAQLLESSIAQRPEQWLLLNTLAAEVCRSLPVGSEHAVHEAATAVA